MMLPLQDKLWLNILIMKQHIFYSFCLVYSVYRDGRRSVLPFLFTREDKLRMASHKEHEAHNIISYLLAPHIFVGL